MPKTEKFQLKITDSLDGRKAVSKMNKSMSDGNGRNGGTYIQRTRDWSVRNMVSLYLEAVETFREHYRAVDDKRKISHKGLCTVCDMLFYLKDQQEIIYQPVDQTGKKKSANHNHKLEPNPAETRFIVNVGLLFHMVLIAREMKFIYQHYNDAAAPRQEIGKDLEMSLEKVERLFTEGVDILIDFAREHSNNVMLLAFLIQNASRMNKAIGIRGPELIRLVIGRKNLEGTYFLAGKYFLESGWYEDARRMFTKVLRKNPKNADALALLNEVNLRSAGKAA